MYSETATRYSGGTGGVQGIPGTGYSGGGGYSGWDPGSTGMGNSIDMEYIAGDQSSSYTDLCNRILSLPSSSSELLPGVVCPSTDSIILNSTTFSLFAKSNMYGQERLKLSLIGHHRSGCSQPVQLSFTIYLEGQSCKIYRLDLLQNFPISFWKLTRKRSEGNGSGYSGNLTYTRNKDFNFTDVGYWELKVERKYDSGWCIIESSDFQRSEQCITPTFLVSKNSYLKMK